MGSGQIDFTGGLNTNTRIADNELQECTDVEILDVGSIKPAEADTLKVSKTRVVSAQRLDGYTYYNVGTTLYYKTDSGTETSLGTIGSGTFQALPWRGIHLIRASDKMYKVVEGTLYSLGVTAPTTAPTLALSSQKAKVIDDFEDHTTWTASGTTKADDAVNVKEGTNSMKINVSVAGVEGYVEKAFVSDLTQFTDGTTSGDEDYISFWVYVGDIANYTYIQVAFDINTGDFKNDYFSKVIPITPQVFDQTLNEDRRDTFADIIDKVDYDALYNRWKEDFTPEQRSEFFRAAISNDEKAIFTQYLRDGLKTASEPVTAKRKAPARSLSWKNIRLRKSEFTRHGNASKNWADVQKVRIYIKGTTTSVDASIDDMQMLGGGKLEDEEYRVSYSYVQKFTLTDGRTYEEESALSPEASITGAERQNISITNITASAESGVNYKRVYIRGGGLTYRHEVGEIANATTSLTTDKSELDYVVEAVEDCRKNGLPPTSPTHAVVISGQLYVAVGEKVYFSRPLKPYAFSSTSFLTLDKTVKAVFEHGSDAGILMADSETKYVNPGYLASEGGYLDNHKLKQGCISTDSVADGFYMSGEGVAFWGPGVPAIISGKIRSELLAYSNRTNVSGAYLKGKYYFCITDSGVMYELDGATNVFRKHAGITHVSAGDDSNLYVVKAAGVYTFETDSTKRKAFAFRTAELILPEDSGFRQVFIDGKIPNATIEYYLNDTAKSSKTVTATGRTVHYFDITQEAGNRISVRVSNTSETTTTDTAVYGVYLK